MPKVPLTNKPNGPVPGENYTSDTKNYPWHRPPEHTNFDDMIMASMKQLTQKKATYDLLNTLQMGISIVDATTMFILSGIGNGKWAVDHGILLAGPVAKIMQIMADSAKIKYNLGLEGDPIPTSSFFDAVKNVDQESVSFAQEAARSEVSKLPPPSAPTAVPMATDTGIAPSAGGFAPKPAASNVNPNEATKNMLPPVLPMPLSKLSTSVGGQ